MSIESQVARARAFAVEAHGDQRYGEEPYVVHLEAVHATAVEFGVTDAPTLIAAWLHDVVEDTDVTREQVAAEFGDAVATLVHAVTNEPGSNRKERAKLTYPKIASTPGAVRLKLADRIANVRACLETRSGLLRMYQREYRKFRGALCRDGDPIEGAMWAELDALLEWTGRG